MANDFSNWGRPANSKPAAKEPLEVKWRASHAGAVRERRNQEDNPYRAEAERDRVIFRWVMLFVALGALAVYVLFFMAPAKESKPRPKPSSSSTGSSSTAAP